MLRLATRLVLLATVLGSVPSSVAAQVRADPGVVIDGRVVVRFLVTLSDESDPYFPVRDLRLRIARLPGGTDTTSVRTDATGIGDFALASGEYQLTTDATTWKGRRYAWEMRLAVRPGMRAIELTAANAVGSAARRPGGVRAPNAPAAGESSSESRSARTSGAFFSGSLGYLRSDADDGVSVSLGLGGLTGRLIGLLIPVDLALVPNRDDRYFTDEFGGGNSVCRDRETGQTAADSKCSPDIVYAAAAEAGVVLVTGPVPLYVTGGYRFGSGETAYGALTLAFQRLPGRHWYLRGSAGQEYIQVSVGGSFPW
jgi:hypothetical protein